MTALVPSDRPSSPHRPHHQHHSASSSSSSSSSSTWNRRERGVWSPAPTRETFKDVLIFEERLKQNAERLQKQRRKYQAFLVSLALLIVHFAYNVFVLPSIYSLVHYLNVALLLVSLVTLVLFFATGMYSEKIAYAYRFVPQANRALRPLNIYLNTRKRSWISYLSLFRIAASPPVAPPPSLATTPKSSPSPSPSPSPSASPGSMSPVTLDVEPSIPNPSNKTSRGGSRRTSIRSSSSAATIRSTRPNRSPPGSRSSSPPTPTSSTSTSSSTSSSDPVSRTLPSTSLKRSSSGRSPSIGIPLPPIPPAQNPRGELIFSSRVSPVFREGYERYRHEWERRRVEAHGLTGAVSGNGSWGSWAWVWSGVGRRQKERGGARGQGGVEGGTERERTGSILGAAAPISGGEKEPRGRRKRALTGSSSTTSSRQVSPSRVDGTGKGGVVDIEAVVDSGIEEGEEGLDGEDARPRPRASSGPDRTGPGFVLEETKEDEPALKS